MTHEEKVLTMIAGLVVVVLVGIVAWSISTREEEVLVGQDMCPKDRNRVPGYAMVLLDLSEPLIGGNAEEFKRKLLDIGGSLDRYGKLVVFDIHDRDRTIISMCRPQRREECDPKTAPRACKGVQEEYERTFEEPILSRIGEFLSRQSERPSSPIIESVADVALLTEFVETPPGKKTLYIVSDMLQHTPGVYSHHRRSAVTADEFENLSQQSYYLAHKPNLQGVSVRILYLLRGKYRHLQSYAHKAFWKVYFTSGGAQSVDIRAVNFVGGGTSGTGRVVDAEAQRTALIPKKASETGVQGSVQGAGAVNKRTSTVARTQAQEEFTVYTVPPNASVSFINSTAEYHHGVKLPPGDYEVEIAAPGHLSHRRVVQHGNAPTFLHIILIREEN